MDEKAGEWQAHQELGAAQLGMGRMLAGRRCPGSVGYSMRLQNLPRFLKFRRSKGDAKSHVPDRPPIEVENCSPLDVV